MKQELLNSGQIQKNININIILINELKEIV